MARNPNSLFLYQALIAFWILTFVSMGFVFVWALFYLQEPKDRKRPGINLKEI